jgi:DNA polymerase-3 subunit gamma/tau
VKFIFATTEVHKVPITILSRVQRFDFKLISAQVIAARLWQVLKDEGIQSDEAAVSVLAREAAGSMRDAMSLLDQVIAWGGSALVGEDVARVLGVASHAVLYDLARALLSGDAARCLAIVAELSDLGYDIAHVARDTLSLLRNLVVAKVCPEPATLLDLPDEEARDVMTLARSADADDLMRLHQGLAAGFDEVVKSGQPRAAFEMLLVRLARRPPLVPLDALVGRLAQLERRLAGTAPRSPPGRGPGQPANEGGPPARPRDARPTRESKPEASDDSGEPPPASELDAEYFRSTESEPPFSRPPSEPPRATVVQPARAPEPEATPVRTPEPEPTPARARAPETAAQITARATEAPTLAQEIARGTPAGAPAEPANPDELLKNVVARVASERPELAAKLEHAVALELREDKLVLGWAPGNLFGQLVANSDATPIVERACSALLGRTIRVVHELESARAAGKKTLSVLSAEDRERKVREAYETARRHPRITEAVEILGARLKDLRLAKAP